MSDPRTRTLVVEQGRSLRQPFRLRNRQTGETIDLPAAGYTSAKLQIRTAHLSEGGDLLLTLSTDNGGVVLGLYDDGTGTLWSGYIYAGATTTAALTPWGEGVFDFAATHESGQVDTIARGPSVLVPQVTEG
jgi:hypothetical protein